MSATAGGNVRSPLGPTLPVLAVAAAAIAYESVLPTALAFLIAAAGIAAGVGLRGVRWPRVRSAFPVPVLVALGALAASAPVGGVPVLFVGVGGVVFVAWLADDPYRPAAGPTRGLVEWAVPALGVGIAWASSDLLPSSAASLGVAGGLAVAAVVALAFLAARPGLFDRDAAETV